MLPCPKQGTLLGMSQGENRTGSSIRNLRTLAGLTLADVAAEAGTNVSYLSRVETGDVTASTQYVARVTAAIASRMAGVA